MKTLFKTGNNSWAMTNKEKLKKLVTCVDPSLISEINERIKNREMLLESQNIALQVLIKLDELNWTQKRLAEAVGLSLKQVSNMLSGKQNLPLESLLKLEKVLNIGLLAKAN
jgi:antitoxin component HigA of HigAB toxin-antitoxin module